MTWSERYRTIPPWSRLSLSEGIRHWRESAPHKGFEPKSPFSGRAQKDLPIAEGAHLSPNLWPREEQIEAPEEKAGAQ